MLSRGSSGFIAAGKTIVDPNVTAFDPPERLEPVPKGHDAGL
jgi:hypothetical protein